MTKNLPSLCRLGIVWITLCICTKTVGAQTLARHTALPQNNAQTEKPTIQKLRTVLNELKSHYRVDILFEGGLVEGLSVSTELIDLNGSLEKKSGSGSEGRRIAVQKSEGRLLPHHGFAQRQGTGQGVGAAA
jgi:hypothetical protein